MWLFNKEEMSNAGFQPASSRFLCRRSTNGVSSPMLVFSLRWWSPYNISTSLFGVPVRSKPITQSLISQFPLWFII